MNATKRAKSEDGTTHITPAGRSVLQDLVASAEEAVELEMRSTLLRGLERWFASSDLTRPEAAKVLAITQARVSDLKRGKISQFSLEILVRLATQAGLRPTLRLAA
jgi:predicted XRE-type DNA-binding protein